MVCDGLQASASIGGRSVMDKKQYFVVDIGLYPFQFVFQPEPQQINLAAVLPSVCTSGPRTPLAAATVAYPRTIFVSDVQLIVCN